MFGEKRLIFYELNEVPLRILEWFASEFPFSAVARLMSRSRVYKTHTEDQGHLSPWITWPTLHRGVTNKQHTISDFGQELRDINEEFLPLWDLLARSGRRVGLFGSLHSYPLPRNLDGSYAFYVPDTFAAGPECFPKELETFQSFNLAMMDRSGRNVTSGIAFGEAAKFIAKAPGLGLRGATVMKLAGQLAKERFKPERIVRRRTSQTQIAFDFFLNLCAHRRQRLLFSSPIMWRLPCTATGLHYFRTTIATSFGPMIGRANGAMKFAMRCKWPMRISRN